PPRPRSPGARRTRAGIAGIAVKCRVVTRCAHTVVRRRAVSAVEEAPALRTAKPTHEIFERRLCLMGHLMATERGSVSSIGAYSRENPPRIAHTEPTGSRLLERAAD